MCRHCCVKQSCTMAPLVTTTFTLSRISLTSISCIARDGHISWQDHVLMAKRFRGNCCLYTLLCVSLNRRCDHKPDRFVGWRPWLKLLRHNPQLCKKVCQGFQLFRSVISSGLGLWKTERRQHIFIIHFCQTCVIQEAVKHLLATKLWRIYSMS